jgi:eukaryotic-like serine/threonine-protein kinase
MTSERWKQIDALFEAALERDLEERAPFLDHACAGDDALRKQVESLLDSEAQSRDFIERPAVEMAAQALSNQQTKLMRGRVVGAYKILHPLSAGGMGQIFLAKDTRLGRRVALKLLPIYFTQDEDRLRRFEQEARAVSALNHPNIVTIYEVGQADALHFIAAEFIEGETLRQQMRSRKIGLGEALDLGIQVAGALAAAHEAGIVHRDIKPENIMLRRDGYVKVVDFGLAKLTELQGLVIDPDAPTLVDIHTHTGVVLGTTNYMSPEQVRGLDLDARSDIFSLGIVLYEVIAGHSPFEGETRSDMFASILTREPPPIVRYQRDAPLALEDLLAKALRKDREERYQTARELLIDLKDVRHQLEWAAQPNHPAPRDRRDQAMGRGAQASKRSQGMVEIDGRPPGDAATGPLGVSARKVFGAIKQHKVAVALTVGPLLIAAIYLFYVASK